MMLLAILAAATELLETRSSLQVWACRFCVQVAVSTMLITLRFARPCWPGTCLFWGGGGEGGFHMLPRGAPSRGAKLCTYLRWFARPDRITTEPCYELPLAVTKLRSIFHFRVDQA